MAYGHAERTLAAIRLLEAETRELLDRLPQLDPEQSQWRQEECLLPQVGQAGRRTVSEDGPAPGRFCAPGAG